MPAVWYSAYWIIFYKHFKYIDTHILPTQSAKSVLMDCVCKKKQQKENC